MSLSDVISQENEETIIDDVLAGNNQSYSKLVDRYKSYAYTIAYKMLEHRMEAEEVAQDSFIKAFHHLKDFNRQAKFSTWLYRIVFNTALSQKRKSRYQFQSIEKSIIEHPQTADNLERNDKEIYVAQALAQLSEHDRLSLQLFYLKEFSLEEIASIVGQPVATVKVRIHRARIKIADELKKILKDEALTL